MPETAGNAEKHTVSRLNGSLSGKAVTKANAVLASSELAMALLVVILTCCFVGVTVLRGEQAWSVIFNSLWFNSILVLLVINIVFCFFGRIWGRRLTIVSIGMILFHLSFVSILFGIVYNSLFHFRGSLRLTEGETLPNDELSSYDEIYCGRFFDQSKLKGESTLVRMQTKLMINGEDKRAAYNVEIGEPGIKKKGLIYVTKFLEYKGFYYYADKEGYSPLVVLHDKTGQEVYSACVSLQSLKQNDGSYLYTTGTKQGPGTFRFPQSPEQPRYDLMIAYHLDPVQERKGDVTIQVWPASGKDQAEKKPLAVQRVPVGSKVNVGEHFLSVKEIRYWAGMSVRYDPGKPIVLCSLWVALAGLVLTTLGRMKRSN